MSDDCKHYDRPDEVCPFCGCGPKDDDPFAHIMDKYFPFGLDDDSGPGGDEPFSPTPGAW